MKKAKKMNLKKIQLTTIQNLDKITGGGPLTTGCLTSICITNDKTCAVRTVGCCDNV